MLGTMSALTVMLHLISFRNHRSMNFEVVPKKTPRYEEKPHPLFQRSLLVLGEPIEQHPEWADAGSDVNSYREERQRRILFRIQVKEQPGMHSCCK
jgi:hypothetical protein